LRRLTTVLVDSNVLLDVVTDDPIWGAWSRQALADAADRSVLVNLPPTGPWRFVVAGVVGRPAALAPTSAHTR
jgi:hypothetical protein